jgi:GT2 family glycosyltransferase
MVQDTFPEVKLIINQKNRGFAVACNQGIRETKTVDILLLNPDTQVPLGQIPELLRAIQCHPQGAVFGPLLVNSDGSRQTSIRRLPTFGALLANFLKIQHLWPTARFLKRYYSEDLDPTKEQKVEQVMGAAFLIRRFALEQVGLLDEEFFIWFEEVDYCARMKEAGLEVWYIPSAHIIHFGAESFKRAPSVKKQWWWMRSALRYSRKYLKISDFLLLGVVGYFSFCISVIFSIISQIFRKKY